MNTNNGGITNLSLGWEMKSLSLKPEEKEEQMAVEKGQGLVYRFCLECSQVFMGFYAERLCPRCSNKFPKKEVILATWNYHSIPSGVDLRSGSESRS